MVFKKFYFTEISDLKLFCYLADVLFLVYKMLVLKKFHFAV